MSIFYVGSYDKNKGIYQCKLDDDGTLSLMKKIETSNLVSYIVRGKEHLYVTYKNTTRKMNGGGVGSFKIEGEDLNELAHCSSNGRSYTHLCVSHDEQYLYAANYHVGTTVSYKLENHVPVNKTCVVYHTGRGPDLFGRQTQPHPHYVGITPEKKYLYSVDLGADAIVLYYYQDGTLIQKGSIDILSGSGPRHMIFSSNGKYAYLINEIANNVMVFVCGDDGLVLQQKISSLPYGFNKNSSAAAIRLSDDERYLFVSNRGHDSIAMYKVGRDTGKVGLLGFYSVGKNPRDFNIIGKYLIAASQDSDELEVFEIGNDELIRLNKKLSIPEPVCICK